MDDATERLSLSPESSGLLARPASAISHRSEASGKQRQSSAPIEHAAIVCTEIQDSTILWEGMPTSMLEAVGIHDEIIRANCQQFDGYESEVLNNAFEIAFRTAKAALQFCLKVQTDLIVASWPAEILTSPCCQQQRDRDYNLISRGLSAKMSIHWGTPISMVNKISGRMDYAGPLVIRSRKALEIANGGQIVVTESFLNELEGSAQARVRAPLVHPKGLGLGLNGEELEDGIPLRSDQAAGPASGPSTASRRPRQQAFAIKDKGVHEFKDLTSPLHLYLMVPASLSGRLLREVKAQEPATGLQGWWEWAKEGVASNSHEANILPV